MTLSALIATGSSLESRPDSLRALVSIAGESLIEHQAKRLAAVGVDTIYVSLDRASPSLMRRIQRIKKHGLNIIVVHRACDLRDVLSPTDSLILVADGLWASGRYYTAIADSEISALIATADRPSTAIFERIDANVRWVGLARVPASLVRELAELPGDWDMVLTLLRFAVQSDTHRMICKATPFEQGEIAIITNTSDTQRLEKLKTQRIKYSGIGMGRLLVSVSLARLTSPLFIRLPIATRCLPWVTVLLWVSVVFWAVFNFPITAASAAVLGCWSLSALHFLSVLRLESRSEKWIRSIFKTFSLTLLVFFPWFIVPIWPGESVSLVEAIWSLAPQLAMQWEKIGDKVALSLCLVAIILVARWCHDELGERYHSAWLLPDADEAWLLLTVAFIADMQGYISAILPVLVLLQILVWLRVAKKQRPTAKSGEK